MSEEILHMFNEINQFKDKILEKQQELDKLKNDNEQIIKFINSNKYQQLQRVRQELSDINPNAKFTLGCYKLNVEWGKLGNHTYGVIIECIDRWIVKKIVDNVEIKYNSGKFCIGTDSCHPDFIAGHVQVMMKLIPEYLHTILQDKLTNAEKELDTLKESITITPQPSVEKNEMSPQSSDKKLPKKNDMNPFEKAKIILQLLFPNRLIEVDGNYINLRIYNSTSWNEYNITYNGQYLIHDISYDKKTEFKELKELIQFICKL